jgi:hypothetical protein
VNQHVHALHIGAASLRCCITAFNQAVCPCPQAQCTNRSSVTYEINGARVTWAHGCEWRRCGTIRTASLGGTGSASFPTPLRIYTVRPSLHSRCPTASPSMLCDDVLVSIGCVEIVNYCVCQVCDERCQRGQPVAAFWPTKRNDFGACVNRRTDFLVSSFCMFLHPILMYIFCVVRCH